VTLFDPVDDLVDVTPAAPADAGAVARLRLTVAYDGTDYRGFAPNRGVITVGGTLGDWLERVLGERFDLTCAGRTDAGVHAWGQVVSFDAPAARVDRLGPDELVRALNRRSDGSIVVRDAAVVAPDFDARFSAVARVYRYTVVNRPVPDPFLRRTAWHVPQPLDLARLRLACDPLIGLHDFTTFCRAKQLKAAQVAAGETPPVPMRRVLDARWHVLDDEVLRFDIEATAFCHQMVRSIVGTLVEAGLGRRTPADVGAALRARDRSACGQLAPPQGLCLWQVRY
jgi:tRNA pseudouridine38-40 synthase